MKVELKNIICTTDFSDISNQAVYFGSALAKELGARLYLCHVIDLSAVAMYGEGFSDPLAQERRIRGYADEHLMELMEGRSVDWEPLVSLGHTADEIARAAKDKGADLVISATHGRSGLKRLVLGSVTERVMRTLPCPLLVVRGLSKDYGTDAAGGFGFHRILVGCDFSPGSALAFEYGLGLGQEFQSEVHLAHVIEPEVYRDLLTQPQEEKEEAGEDLRKRLREKLTQMVPEDAYNWCTPKTALLAGQAHEELTKYAVVHETDLMVLGFRGASLVETLFVGSTTDRVVRQASCPVLCVRPASDLSDQAPEA
ncbi:MAG TPA: universal stress protein [Deltaproteobacteria bacterium]|nr:universal stress protein [Deltaproteobacteria bacterium]